MSISWFRQAAPYIHNHRGRIFVIYFDGETLDQPHFNTFIQDIILLHSLGIRLVLVHGSRPQINQVLQQNNCNILFENQIRITQKSHISFILQAVGSIRMYLESLFCHYKIAVVSGNFIMAKPYGVVEGVDYEHTGLVRKVEIQRLKQQLELNNIILLSNLGYSPSGEVFNLISQTVATQTAIALQADKLLFITEAFPKDLGQEITVQEIESKGLLSQISQQNLKITLEQAILAAKNQVKRIHLLDHSQQDALLQELFTRDGTGLLVTQAQYEILRKATIEDVIGIVHLIAPLEEQGILVKRPREQLEQEIEHFSVLDRDGLIIGCVAFYPYHEEKLAEMACLVIHPDYQQGQRGWQLLQHVEKKAKSQGIEKIFILTTRSSHWFIERGFVQGSIEALPLQKKLLYNYQRNSHIFIKSC